MGIRQTVQGVPGAVVDPRSPASPKLIVYSELALTVSGVLLSIFMVMHLSLLFTVVISAETMDELAHFLERYYLLQIGVAPVIFLLAFHTVLASRRIPFSLARQKVIFQHARSVKHIDTWTWIIQIATGAAIVVLASIHIWVLVTDLPVEASKSAARVIGNYLWVYIPFVAIVESHIAFGLFRVLIKWGVMSRKRAHIVLVVCSAGILAIGYLILANFYWLGAD